MKYTMQYTIEKCALPFYIQLRAVCLNIEIGNLPVSSMGLSTSDIALIGVFELFPQCKELQDSFLFTMMTCNYVLHITPK